MLAKKDNKNKSVFSMFSSETKSTSNLELKKGTKCPVCFKFIENKLDSEVLCSTCFGVYEVYTYDDIRNL